MPKRRSLVIVGTILTIACRGQGDGIPAPLSSCVVGDRVVSARDTVSVAVSQGVNPSAMVISADEGTRLVMRQLYETLVVVDCVGRIHPGLASAWESHDMGREWRFTIRPGAVYWDGVPVSIVDLIEGWERNWEAIEPLVPPGDYFNVTQAIAYDRLVIRLDEPDTLFPARLSHIQMALRRPAASPQAWPIGTGRYSPVRVGANQGTLILRPSDPTRPVLRFVPVGGADARDALDAGLDVVIDRAKEAIDYVGRRPDYVDFPLRWDLRFALAIRRDAVRFGDRTHDDLERLRNAVAHDAVGIDARPSPCQMTFAGTTSRAVSHRGNGVLAYDAADATARALVERLVAIAGARGSQTGSFPAFERVMPAATEQLVPLVRSGRVAAAVVRYTPWQACDGPPEAPRNPDVMWLPLLEGRSHMFALAGRIEALLAWDGVPLFFPGPHTQRP